MNFIDSNSLAQGTLYANRYRIIKPLGKGGMGAVYLAEDSLLDNTQVALKILHSQLNQDPKQLQRFYREVQLARKVTHANIVRTYDVGETDGSVFFTMEHVEGYSLKDCIGEGRPMDLDQVLPILVDIARGLSAIHKAGIIHRDLKPANIMLCADGVARITDFGVARTEMSELTNHDEVIGSAAYLSPEAWMGNNVTHLTDIYALGVLAYEMLSGALPFNANNPAELMFKHLKEVPTSLRHRFGDIPDWLDDLVRKMLAKDPGERPQNAEELALLIEDEILHGTSSLQHQSENIPDATINHGFTHTKLMSSKFASNLNPTEKRDFTGVLINTLFSLTACTISGILLLFISYFFISTLMNKISLSNNIVALNTLLGFIATQILALNFGAILGVFFYSGYGLRALLRGITKPIQISFSIGLAYFLACYCFKLATLINSSYNKSILVVVQNVQDAVWFASQKLIELALLTPTGVVFNYEVSDRGMLLSPARDFTFMVLAIHLLLFFSAGLYIARELSKCTAKKESTKSLLGFMLIGFVFIDLALYFALPDLRINSYAINIKLGSDKLSFTLLSLVLAPIKWSIFLAVWKNGNTDFSRQN